MLTKPDDLDDALIVGELAAGWGIAAGSIEHRALGFGSHHWVADDRWFLTVDEAAKLDRLRAAFAAACALRDDAGLDFVVAPIDANDGSVVRLLGDRYTLAVFPHLDVVGGGSWGGFESSAHRSAACSMVAAVHEAAVDARREDFSLQCRAELELALTETDRVWDGGPYSERARALLASRAADVVRLLDAHERAAAMAAERPFVLTHGEPHSGNVLRTPEGWVLVDWDTALLAPAERDLWHLGDGDPTTADLYRLRWDLAEIAINVTDLRAPHVDSDDNVVRWRGLQEYLDVRERWPSLL